MKIIRPLFPTIVVQPGVWTGGATQSNNAFRIVVRGRHRFAVPILWQEKWECWFDMVCTLAGMIIGGAGGFAIGANAVPEIGPWFSMLMGVMFGIGGGLIPNLAVMQRYIQPRGRALEIAVAVRMRLADRAAYTLSEAAQLRMHAEVYSGQPSTQQVVADLNKLAGWADAYVGKRWAAVERDKAKLEAAWH